MQLTSLKHFICQLQGIDSSTEYLTCENGIYSRTDSKDQKNLNTEAIAKLAGEALQSLQEMTLSPLEKARLSRSLANGLKEYSERLYKHKKFYEKIGERFGFITQSEKALSAQYALAQAHSVNYETLRRQSSAPVAAHSSPPEEVAKEKRDPFSKKFERAKSFDCSDAIFGKPVVYGILQSLQEDPLMAKILDAWHQNKIQSSRAKNSSLIDLIAEKLDGGTCYGQAMKIFELLDSKDRKEITEEYIHQNMVLKDYVRYQILHTLQVFIENEKGAYIYGVPRKEAKEKLEQCFPHYAKRGKSSEKMNLNSFDAHTLIGRLSDFIKNDIRGYQASSTRRDYAIKITLEGKNLTCGHAAIIHYSETQGRYFWYDPYKTNYGLFSTTSHKAFLKGITDKLLEYRDEGEFDQVRFTAYRI